LSAINLQRLVLYSYIFIVPSLHDCSVVDLGWMGWTIFRGLQH